VKNLKFVYLFLVIFLASCLPQEKTTQCNSNEAYDSSKRKCVATLGASSSTVNITNITPAASYVISTGDPSKSHAVTVSDPYNNGFQIKWVLTLPDGNSTLLGTGLSITFNHSTFAQGSYILEVQLLNANGTEVFDSRSWTVNIISDATPTISQLTASPFSTTTTSTPTTISASGNNPDGINNVNYQWYVNGTPIAGESGDFSGTLEALSFDFDPRSTTSYYTGANVYSVQLILTEDISAAVYNSSSWIINSKTPNYANVTMGTSPAFTTTTPTTASVITVISDTEISNSGFLYDVDGDSNLDAVDFCVQIDTVGGVDGDDVFVDFLIDGTIIPAATNQILATANTPYCLQDFNDYKYTIPPSIVAESHTITAVVYDKYTGSTNRPVYNGYAQVDTLTWVVRVRQQNTPPILEIDKIDVASGGIDCASETTTTFSTCEVTHATVFKVALTVTDDDYNPIDFSSEYGKFRVQFYLDGSLLDGTDDISSSDCYEDFSETAAASRYICDLTLNPYDSNGPIDVTGLTYSITAKVTDEDSPYLLSATDSNTVTWLVSTVNDYNSGTAVNQFATSDANHIANPTYSYISTQATPGTAITLTAGSITESEIIQFHVYVDEAERDSHTIKVERCTDLACTGVIVPAIATSTTNSTDNINPRLTTINHQIAEDEVIGTNQADVTYRITVTDSDLATAQTIVTATVNNNNPDPVFNTANFNPTVPSTLVAFTGYPLSIDPGTITDASIIDGETILYQWMYSTDTGTNWIALDGATERILIWSPGQELDYSTQTGTPIRLKLCFGDNGVDAAGVAKTALSGAECKSASLDSSSNVDAAAWDVTVFSNMAQGKSYGDNGFANTSFGELAVWVDPTSVDPVVKYMAYVNVSREIVIEKILTSSDGTKNGSIEVIEELDSIIFDASTDINFSVNDVTNLSMTGDTTNGSLYLSYMAPIAGVDQVHVRRIDISGGKTMLTHDGKFGFDPGYDDLTNNIIVTSTGIDPETINATTGLAELNFTDSANNVAMSVNFNGIHGGSTDVIAGTQFCNPTTACTTITATAAAFATAINESTATELQGFTASAVAGLVTLSGNAEDDFLQADIGATKIGSIMVNQTTGKWQLPLIDHDLAGANKNKIALLQGDLNIRLSNSNMAKSSLLGTVASQDIANDIDANDVVIIATRGYTSGEIAVYEMDTSYTLIDANTDLFNDPNIASIKVAVSKETSEFTPSAYITGTNANNRLAFARIDSSGGDYNFASATTYADLDSGFSLLFDLDNYDITAGNKENQLLIGAVADSDSNTIYEAYLLQVSGAVPQIDCSYDAGSAQDIGKCMKIFTKTTDVVFNLKVALGEVLEDVTIGSAGATAGENTNDIIPFAFHIDDGGGAIASDALPILGILNVTGTTLTATETNSGTGYITPYVAP
jgi:hypothetical protein